MPWPPASLRDLGPDGGNFRALARKVPFKRCQERRLQGTKIAGRSLQQASSRAGHGTGRTREGSEDAGQIMQKIDLYIFNRIAEFEGHLHIAFDREGAREKQRVAVEIALGQRDESREWTAKHRIGLKLPFASAEERKLRPLVGEVEQKMKWEVRRFHRNNGLSSLSHPLGKLRMAPVQRPERGVEERLQHRDRHGPKRHAEK